MASVTSCLLLAALYRVGALDLERLQLPASNFDPMSPQVQDLLKQALGFGSMRVALLPDNHGTNGGVWILTDTAGRARELIVKSRPPAPRLAPELLPEPEHYAKLARELPALTRDPSIIFPSKILACYSPGGVKVTDLIVMRRAPGAILGIYIAKMSLAGQQGRSKLSATFERLGQQLRAFHDAYGMQHTDFQTSNVMVDEADGKITLIDLGSMGQPADEGDLEYMRGTLQVSAPLYAPGFLDDAYYHLERGYHSAGGPPKKYSPRPLSPLAGDVYEAIPWKVFAGAVAAQIAYYHAAT